MNVHDEEAAKAKEEIMQMVDKEGTDSLKLSRALHVGVASTPGLEFIRHLLPCAKP